MKRAKKSPREFFTSSDVQIYSARMRAYLDETQENFRRIIAEAIHSGKEATRNEALSKSEHVTPVAGNVFFAPGFPAEVSAQLKNESDALFDRKNMGPES